MNRDRPDLARLGIIGACATLAAAPAVILTYRHAAPLLAILLGYAVTVPLFWSAVRWPAFLDGLRRAARTPEALLVGLLALLALVSAAFSPARGRALEYWAEMAGSGLLALVIGVAATQLRDERLFRWLMIGVLFGAALLVGDLLTGHRFRALSGDMTRATDSNRAAVLAALCAPLMAIAILRGGSMRFVCAAALALTFAGAWLSHSTSAKLALGVGLLAFALVAFAGRRAVMAAGWLSIAAIVLMPLIAGLFYSVSPASVYSFTEKMSAEARAVIWEGFARLVMLKPWLGYGFEASAVADRLPEAATLQGRMREYLGVGHPHNTPLQIWFELGIPGVALSAAAVFMAFRRIAAAGGRARPAAAAIACAVFAVSCVSHGAWQAWWPLMIALVVAGFPRAREAAP